MALPPLPERTLRTAPPTVGLVLSLSVLLLIVTVAAPELPPLF
jgi:hypothetical protein